jgi:hypothetical protein
MQQRSGRLLAPTRALGAVLLAVGVGLAIGLRGQPGSTPSVLRDEPAAPASPLKREPAAPSVASNGWRTATTPAAPSLEIKCRIGLASCRKWVALQERKGRLLLHIPQR